MFCKIIRKHIYDFYSALKTKLYNCYCIPAEEIVKVLTATIQKVTFPAVTIKYSPVKWTLSSATSLLGLFL